MIYSVATSRGVLRKRCSENMQQIYRRTPISKCDFNKVAKRLVIGLGLEKYFNYPSGLGMIFMIYPPGHNRVGDPPKLKKFNFQGGWS